MMIDQELVGIEVVGMDVVEVVEDLVIEVVEGVDIEDIHMIMKR